MAGSATLRISPGSISRSTASHHRRRHPRRVRSGDAQAMSAPAAAVRLSPDEVEGYRDAGIVIPRYRLPSARIERLRSTLDRLVAENPTVRPERLVSAHIEGRNG